MVLRLEKLIDAVLNQIHHVPQFAEAFSLRFGANLTTSKRLLASSSLLELLTKSFEVFHDLASLGFWNSENGKNMKTGTSQKKNETGTKSVEPPLKIKQEESNRQSHSGAQSVGIASLSSSLAGKLGENQKNQKDERNLSGAKTIPKIEKRQPMRRPVAPFEERESPEMKGKVLHGQNIGLESHLTSKSCSWEPEENGENPDDLATQPTSTLPKKENQKEADGPQAKEKSKQLPRVSLVQDWMNLKLEITSHQNSSMISESSIQNDGGSKQDSEKPKEATEHHAAHKRKDWANHLQNPKLDFNQKFPESNGSLGQEAPVEKWSLSSLNQGESFKDFEENQAQKHKIGEEKLEGIPRIFKKVAGKGWGTNLRKANQEEEPNKEEEQSGEMDQEGLLDSFKRENEEHSSSRDVDTKRNSDENQQREKANVKRRGRWGPGAANANFKREESLEENHGMVRSKSSLTGELDQKPKKSKRTFHSRMSSKSSSSEDRGKSYSRIYEKRTKAKEKLKKLRENPHFYEFPYKQYRSNYLGPMLDIDFLPKKKKIAQNGTTNIEFCDNEHEHQPLTNTMTLPSST